MSDSVKTMVDAANAAVEKISMETANALMTEEDALLVDVRDGPELEASGKIAGARHVSRGMLEFRADPAAPTHDEAFRKERPVIVYCASGGRAALAGKRLQDMGYGRVYNLGAFKDWAEAGGEIERPTGGG